MTLRRLLPALALATAAALGVAAMERGGEDGGGGGAADDGRRAVEVAAREFVARTNRRDPSVCDELVTDRFVRAGTGRGGAAGRAACKRDLERATRLRIDLRGVRDTRVDGDRARTTLVYVAEGVRQTRTLRLVRAGERYRVDAVSGP